VSGTHDEIDRPIEDPAAVRSFLDPDDAASPRVKTVRLKGLAGLMIRLFPERGGRA
jgi:hypothetical protein